MKSIILSAGTLVLVAGCSQGLVPEPGDNTGVQQVALSSTSVAVDPAAGVAYQHTAVSSRFNVGAGSQEETEGTIVRLVGDRGAFATDTVTHASLAVLSGATAEKYPLPLTTDPDAHTSAAKSYLLGLGIPAREVGGTHVTATMAGGGPAGNGVQPAQSKLLWYTTHLERSVGGVPVEGSFAYAALDNAGGVITEGVYWPAIAAAVVREAQSLGTTLGSPTVRASFLAKARAARPDIGGSDCEVKIVHTTAGYHGAFEAKAVCSVVARGSVGKAAIIRFDSNGAAIVLGDEKPQGVDSAKP